MNSFRISVTGDNPPPAVATAEGLPSIATQNELRDNAKLFWQGARARVAGSGTPNTREGRPGVLVQLNGSALLRDMWDGYDPSPMHTASTAARVAIYNYLRDAGNMICTQRRSGNGSTWWIAAEWRPRPPGSDAPPMDITYICVFPGCGDGRAMLPQVLGRHLATRHNITFADYKQMAAGEIPWTDGKRKPVRETPPKLLIPVMSGQVAWTDPLDAVEALVAEVKKNRALVSDSDLVDENKFLRSELEETRAQNTRLRQRLAAADKALGRR